MKRIIIILVIMLVGVQVSFASTSDSVNVHLQVNSDAGGGSEDEEEPGMGGASLVLYDNLQVQVDDVVALSTSMSFEWDSNKKINKIYINWQSPDSGAFHEREISVNKRKKGRIVIDNLISDENYQFKVSFYSKSSEFEKNIFVTTKIHPSEIPNVTDVKLIQDVSGNVYSLIYDYAGFNDEVFEIYLKNKRSRLDDGELIYRGQDLKLEDLDIGPDDEVVIYVKTPSGISSGRNVSIDDNVRPVSDTEIDKAIVSKRGIMFTNKENCRQSETTFRHKCKLYFSIKINNLAENLSLRIYSTDDSFRGSYVYPYNVDIIGLEYFNPGNYTWYLVSNSKEKIYDSGDFRISPSVDVAEVLDTPSLETESGDPELILSLISLIFLGLMVGRLEFVSM